MFVYVLTARDQIYVGLTRNLDQRLEYHARGKCRTTKKLKAEWKLHHSWKIRGFITASKWERILHSLDDKEVLKFCENFPVWVDELVELTQGLKTTKYELKQHLKYLTLGE